MKNKMKIKFGFTLFEIIISLSVILILALMGVASFGNARNSMGLNLKTDEVINSLHKMREYSRTSPKCLGIYFTKDAVVNGYSIAEGEYTDKSCGLVSHKSFNSNLGDSTNNGIVVSKILINGTESNSLTVLFQPPKGAIVFLDENESVIQDAENAEITFESTKTRLQSRTILINKNSNSIEKK